MNEAIVTYLPWLLSILTIYSAFLAGQKKASSWTVGLVNQALWLVWIFAGESWGLLPMNIALWVIFARNLRLWRREQAH